MFHILLKRLNASLLPPSLDSIWPEDVGEDRGRLTKADDLANVIDGADPLINDGLPAMNTLGGMKSTKDNTSFSKLSHIHNCL